MKSDYRADIDGLRAIAILLVVIFHFDILAIGKAGFIGVDIFFVISGFLITGIISRDLAAGKFSFRSFLYRRVRRLYPAMVVTFLAFGVFAWFRFLPDLFEELAKETLFSLLYMVNFYFWRTVNYFGLHAGSAPLLHTWSLAVEEQFYLFFPPFCILVNRFFTGRLRAGILIAGFLSFGLGLVTSGWKPEASFYLLPTRAWELMLGGSIALYIAPNLSRGQLLSFAGPLGLVLIVLALIVYTPATEMPGWFALLPTVGAAALIVGGFCPQAPVTRFLSLRPIVWIGRISYPLYLVHWPIWISLQDQLPSVSWTWRIAGLGFSIFSAWAIYAFVETPIRQRQVISSPGNFIGIAVVMSGALIGLAIVAIRTAGLPERFTPQVQTALAFAGDLPNKYGHCEYRLGHKEITCRLGISGIQPTMLLMGDSHARALAGAFDIFLKKRKQAAIFTFASGCLPVQGAGSQTCVDFVDNAVHTAATEKSVKEIVLVSIWRQAYEGSGMLFNGTWHDRRGAANTFSTNLVKTVQALIDEGKEVTLVDPLYAAPHAVPETLAKNLAFGYDWPIDTSYKTYRDTFSDLFVAFDKSVKEGVRHISLIGDLCRSKICPGVWQGRPVFSDNNHLAFGMSAYMAKILEHEMPQSLPN